MPLFCHLFIFVVLWLTRTTNGQPSALLSYSDSGNSPFEGAAFFPNGSMFVTSSSSAKAVAFWTISANTLVSRFTTGAFVCGQCIAVDPSDPSVIALCCSDGVRLYRTNGTLIRQLGTSATASVFYNPRFPTELITLSSTAVTGFNTATGSQTFQIAGGFQTSSLNCLAVSPHDVNLIAVATASSVLVYDKRTVSAPKRTFSATNPVGVLFNPSPSNSTMLLIILVDTTWNLVYTDGSRFSNGSYTTGRPTCAAFHPAGSEFVYGDSGGNNYLYDSPGIAPRTSWNPGISWGMKAVLYNPAAGNKILSVTSASAMSLWTDARSPATGLTTPTPNPPAPLSPSNTSTSTQGSPPAFPTAAVAGIAGASALTIGGVTLAAWKLKLCARLACLGGIGVMKKMADDENATKGEGEEEEGEEFDGLESIEASQAEAATENATA